MAYERTPASRIIATTQATSYRPPEEKVASWHKVAGKSESLGAIAQKYGISTLRLFDLNFPGSVENKKVIPEVVNWYLHFHKEFNCPETVDKQNRRFKGGEMLAIPYKGDLTIEEPVFLTKPKPEVVNSDAWLGIVGKGGAMFGPFGIETCVGPIIAADSSGRVAALSISINRIGLGIGAGVGAAVVIGFGFENAHAFHNYQQQDNWQWNLSLGGKASAIAKFRKIAPLISLLKKLGATSGKALSALAKLKPDDWANIIKQVSATRDSLGIGAGEQTLIVIDFPMSPIPAAAEASVFAALSTVTVVSSGEL